MLVWLICAPKVNVAALVTRVETVTASVSVKIALVPELQTSSVYAMKWASYVPEDKPVVDMLNVSDPVP
jgi:hypothetical protein